MKKEEVGFKTWLETKREAVQNIFPSATVWGILDNGKVDLSRYKAEFGRIRLFCCTNLFHGDIFNFPKLMECARILGANEYSIKPSSDGNNWVELYYRMGVQEIVKQEIIEKRKELKNLQKKAKV